MGERREAKSLQDPLFASPKLKFFGWEGRLSLSNFIALPKLSLD